MATIEQLANELLRARDEGIDFEQAWGTAVAHTLTTTCDPSDWADVLTLTRDAWQRAYNREPAPRAEIACGVLHNRGPGIPLEGLCCVCLNPLPPARTKHQRLYCSAKCRHVVSHANERREANAA
jgi:hypothetical protein